jgi:hypothetical protein
LIGALLFWFAAPCSTRSAPLQVLRKTLICHGISSGRVLEHYGQHTVFASWIVLCAAHDTGIQTITKSNVSDFWAQLEELKE